jgi:hypothetical protein
MLTSNVQAGVGVAPMPQDGRMTARGRSFLIGEVGALDFNLTYATDNEVGSLTSGFSTVRLVQGGDLRAGFVGVWVDDVADRQRARFSLQGEVRAYVQNAGSVSAGADLYAVAGQTYLSPTSPVGSKLVGKLLDAIVDATTPVLARVLFSGVNGMGGRSS